MFIRIASDIHQEFFPKGYIFEMEHMPEDKDTVLVLAGDVDVGSGAVQMLEVASRRFAHVVYICGNHEFYNHTIGLVELDLKEKTRFHSNIHFLNGDSVVIDNVRFWGHTFWSHSIVPDEWMMWQLKQTMNDYHVIKRINTSSDKIVAFDPNCQAYYHATARVSLRKFLNTSFDGKTVVVTHHAPSFKSVSPRFANSTSNCAYASDLDHAIEGSGIDLWCHGHMHESADYMIDKTRIVLNPYGYHGHEVNPGYDPLMRIEL